MKKSLFLGPFLSTTLLFLSTGILLLAQDDVTTQNGSSGYNGAWITGPASNPLSFLNGPAYRTTGQNTPYDFPRFRSHDRARRQLPPWIGFGLEERFRCGGMENQSFKLNNDDNYLLNRWRFLMQIKPNNWLRDRRTGAGRSRLVQQMPPLQPPNTNRFDLKLAYAEFGDPEKQWISVRVGRQLINYNNTIIANSEWRDQGRSYDAVVTNLHVDRVRLGIFAASVVVPLDEGISHHQEGNNIYGLYGAIDNPRADVHPGAVRALARESECRGGDSHPKPTPARKRAGLRHSLEGSGFRQSRLLHRGHSRGGRRRHAITFEPGAPPTASLTASPGSTGSRASSANTITLPATRIPTTACMGLSTPCTRPRTTASASPINSDGRTSRRFAAALPSNRTTAGL